MTSTDINIDNMNKLIGYIRDEMREDDDSIWTEHVDEDNIDLEGSPDMFSLRVWYGSTRCGTVACIGGTTEFLMRREGLFDDAEDDLDKHHLSVSDLHEWLGLSEDEMFSICHPDALTRAGDANHGTRYDFTIQEAVEFLEKVRDGKLVYVPGADGCVKSSHWTPA